MSVKCTMKLENMQQIRGLTFYSGCGTLSEELAKGAQRGHTQVMYFKTLDKMMLALVPYLRNGDTVLVKASHFMEFSKVVEAICKAWEE